MFLLVLVHRDPVGWIADGTTSLLFSRVIRLCVKRRGLLSIATQELLLALQPSPLALTMASRPGIPAAAELARGPGPEDVEHLGEHGEEGAHGTGCCHPREVPAG